MKNYFYMDFFRGDTYYERVVIDGVNGIYLNNLEMLFNKMFFIFKVIAVFGKFSKMSYIFSVKLLADNW